MASTASAPVVVSPNEAARLLGVTRQTIYNLAYAGAFRMVKISERRTGIPYVELMAYVDKAPTVEFHRDKTARTQNDPPAA